MPPERIALPQAVQHLISEYFYAEDAPIFGADVSNNEPQDIRLRPGLLTQIPVEAADVLQTSAFETPTAMKTQA